MQPQLHSLSLEIPEPHKMAYWQWPTAQPDALTLLCVHGLTRNRRDFDFLAEDLSSAYNILAPDVAGRGESDWLVDTKHYHYGTYFADILALLEARKLAQVDWLGTSMGGILGMWMAAAQPQRIRKLVLNDIGAVIPRAGLERINRYVGLEMEFSDRASAETKLREIFAPFGLNAEWQWQHLLEHSFRKLNNGAYQLAYDPAILDPVRDAAKNLAGEGDTLLWEWWDKITCPILVLRGEESDILTAPILEEMLARNPHAASLTFPSIGHAPALMDAEQIRLVREWLLFGH